MEATPQERILAAEEAKAEARADAVADEQEASVTRTATPGFPIATVDGEVMAVGKVITETHLANPVDADGVEYELDTTTGLYAAVGTVDVATDVEPEPEAPAAPAENGASFAQGEGDAA